MSPNLLCFIDRFLYGIAVKNVDRKSKNDTSEHRKPPKKAAACTDVTAPRLINFLNK